MMKLPQIETLLLQEMENVKGGRAGTCECFTGAAQGPLGSEGTCICSNGGAAQVTKPPIDIPVCVCPTTGAGQ